jgi:hypothetical protein
VVVRDHHVLAMLPQDPAPASKSQAGLKRRRAGDMNCSDFHSQGDAQAEVRSDPSDPNKLDTDKDGFACESKGTEGLEGRGALTAPTPTGPLTAHRCAAFGSHLRAGARIVGAGRNGQPGHPQIRPQRA